MLRIHCPHCSAANTVSPSAMGEYVPCVRCHTKFYVPVPPLDKEAPTAAAPAGTPNVLTPQERAHAAIENPRPVEYSEQGLMQTVLRQEALLATLCSEVRILRWLLAAAVLVAAASTAAAWLR